MLGTRGQWGASGGLGCAGPQGGRSQTRGKGTIRNISMGLTFSRFKAGITVLCASAVAKEQREACVSPPGPRGYFPEPPSTQFLTKMFTFCLKITEEKLQPLEAPMFMQGTTKGSWKSQQPSAHWGLLSVGLRQCTKRMRRKTKTNKN